MLMPSVMGTDLFDTFFNDSWFDDRDFRNTEKKLYGHHAKNLMQTDIKERMTPTSLRWIFRDLRKMKSRHPLRTVT